MVLKSTIWSLSISTLTRMIEDLDFHIQERESDVNPDREEIEDLHNFKRLCENVLEEKR